MARELKNLIGLSLLCSKISFPNFPNFTHYSAFQVACPPYKVSREHLINLNPSLAFSLVKFVYMTIYNCIVTSNLKSTVFLINFILKSSPELLMSKSFFYSIIFILLVFILSDYSYTHDCFNISKLCSIILELFSPKLISIILKIMPAH